MHAKQSWWQIESRARICGHTFFRARQSINNKTHSHSACGVRLSGGAIIKNEIHMGSDFIALAPLRDSDLAFVCCTTKIMRETQRERERERGAGRVLYILHYQ
jgi:hypothetical protein